jgi:hypothetical protein
MLSIKIQGTAIVGNHQSLIIQKGVFILVVRKKLIKNLHIVFCRLQRSSINQLLDLLWRR